MARSNKPRETPRNLTKTYLEALQPVPGRRAARVWDATVKGFGVSVTAAGVKSYFFNYRVDGIERRYTLGRFPDLPVSEARKEALLLKARVAKGEDPLEDRRERRRKRISEPTVRDLCERALREHYSTRAAETARAAGWLFRKHLLPALGSRPVSRVTWLDIDQLHREVGKERPFAANRLLAVVSKLFELGSVWGWYPRDQHNPGREHSKFKEPARGRSLSREELARVGTALEADHHTVAVAAYRVTLLTGCRPGEVLSVRWADVDFASRVLDLKTSKTGARKVILGAAAIEVLKSLEGSDLSEPDRLVFAVDGRALGNVRRLWERVLVHAQIPSETRLYDSCRHTFGSWAAELGVPQEIRMTLMGHRGKGSHSRYIHREKSLLDAADLVAGQLAAALRGEEVPTAKVLPMRA
jgi:integrase